jgi:hypothetical protein
LKLAQSPLFKIKLFTYGKTFTRNIVSMWRYVTPETLGRKLVETLANPGTSGKRGNADF